MMLEKIIRAMEEAMQCASVASSDFYVTTVKDLYNREKGNHTGVYIAYNSMVAYYVGIATKGNTINERFQPHYAKFTANLPALYGGLTKPKKETRWQFPKNWREGVKEHFLLNENIPDYWIGKQKKEIIQPYNLDWRPVFKPGVDVDQISVVVWDLTELPAHQIDDLETTLVKALKPVFNGSKIR